jgi:hypothetical protein
MITPNEVKRKSIPNFDPENYSHTLEVRINDALRYDPCKNRVHCDLALSCLTTYSINTLFKYIDAGYDVMISNESNENNDITLTIYHHFNNRDN